MDTVKIIIVKTCFSPLQVKAKHADLEEAYTDAKGKLREVSLVILFPHLSRGATGQWFPPGTPVSSTS